MSALIAYNIKFDGLDSSIVKFRTLLGLMDQVTRKSGLLGSNINFNNSNGSKGGNNVIVPAGGAAGAAEIGVITAASNKILTNTDKTFQNVGKIIEDGFATLNPKYQEVLKNLGFGSIGGGLYQKNPPLSYGLGPNESVPPFLPKNPPKVPVGFRENFSANLSQTGKYATFMKGFQNSGGGIGGIGGGLGAVAGSLGPLVLATAALTGAFVLLKGVVHILSEGIKEGAKAYQQAARYGKSVSKTFTVDSAFKAIGMETPDLSIIRGQLGGKGKGANETKIPDTEIILSAARAGELGNVQQLLNMANEFRKAMQDAANNARQMEYSSKATQNLSEQTSAIGREFKTMLAQIATDNYFTISLFLSAIQKLAAAINWIIEQSIKFKTAIGLIPENKSENKDQISGLGGSGGTQPTQGPWEKIGLLFKSPSEKPLNLIATNTSKIAQTMELSTKINLKVADAILKAVSFMNPATTLGYPSLP